MKRAVAAQLAIRYVPSALALGFLASRLSYDWQYMTPRDVLDVVQASLFIALPSQLFQALPAENHVGFRVVFSPSGTWFALVLAAGIGGIITYNACIAWQRLDCVATVRADIPTASRESLAAEAACLR